MTKPTQKLFALLLSVVLILYVTPFGAFTAFAETEGILTYEINGDEATITGLADEEYSGDVIIPSAIGGYPVTSIGDAAFEDCQGLTGVPYRIA